MSDRPISQRAGAPPPLSHGWLTDTALPRLVAEPEIQRAGRTFSGVIGLGVDRRTTGLVFSAGKLLAVERGPGLRGTTFTIRATSAAWEALLASPRNLFLRHFHAGEVQVEGDLIEFLRLTELVLLIVGGLRGDVSSDPTSPAPLRPGAAHLPEDPRRLDGETAAGAELIGRYVDVQGLRTYYESVDATDDQIGTVVCVHSAGQDSSQWHPTIEALAPRGVRVIALDLPGHGKSARPPGGPIEDLGTYADFVWAFTQVIGLDRPAITGCSIGGCISLQLAVAYGDGLAAVVAAAATDHNPTVPPAGLELARADAGIPGWADRAAAYAAAATGERCPPERRAELAWKHRGGDSKVANGDLRGWNAHDVRGKLGSAACALTIVVGEEDFYLPAERIAALRQELGEERVVVLPGIGHYPMLEWDGFPDFLLAHTFGAI